MSDAKKKARGRCSQISRPIGVAPVAHKASGLPLTTTNTTMRYNEEDISYEDVTTDFLEDLLEDMADAFVYRDASEVEQCVYVIDDPRLEEGKESTLIVTMTLTTDGLEVEWTYDNSDGVKDFPAFDETNICRSVRWAENQLDAVIEQMRDEYAYDMYQDDLFQQRYYGL